MQRRICFRQPPSQSRHNLCISAAASFAPVSLLFMATPTTGHELAASPAATAAAIYVPRLALTAALSMSHDGNPEQPKKLGNTFFFLVALSFVAAREACVYCTGTQAQFMALSC